MTMKMFKNASAMAIAIALTAFENKAGWKMDGDKIAVDATGNPIYLKEDGGEQSVDGGTISRLNGEARGHRERAEKLEGDLKAFAGLDPVAAKDAIAKLSKIDTKALIDAGEVDRVKDEIGKQYTGQIAERDGKIGDLEARVNAMTLDTAFSRSQFISDNVAVPREMFEATFARNFKFEDGKVVPYDASGNKVFSKKRMGEVADVDEALSIIVEAYPHKDAILKAPTQGGSGNGGGGGMRGTGRAMTRAEFEALPPAQAAEAAGLIGKGELTVND